MEDQDETLPFEISTDLNACGTEMSSRNSQIAFSNILTIASRQSSYGWFISFQFKIKSYEDEGNK